MNLISIYELAGCALILAFYRAYLKNLPNIEYRMTRAEKLNKVQLIQRYIDRIDHEILEPCEELQKSLRNLVQKYTPRNDAREPTVVIPIPKRHRRVNPRLFRYTPRGKVFVRVYRDDKAQRLSPQKLPEQAEEPLFEVPQFVNQNQPTPNQPLNQNQPTQRWQPQHWKPRSWQNRQTRSWQNRRSLNRQTQNQLEEDEFDMTNAKKLNKFGVNSSRDPYWHPQPRHPLSSVDCNKATRRYPASLYPDLKPNSELKPNLELKPYRIEGES